MRLVPLVMALSVQLGCAASVGNAGVYPMTDGAEGDGIPSAEDAAQADGATGLDTQVDALSADSGADSAKGDANTADLSKADSAKTDTAAPTSAMTVASCPDGQFTEVMSNPSGDISALVQGYNAASGLDFVAQALGVRYPLGQFIMTEGAKQPMGGGKTCMQTFWQASQAGNAAGALGQASTLVHECGHVFDLAKSAGGHTYYITDAVQFTCPGLSYQGANKGFARSLIKTDSFGAKWPACAKFGDQGCDGYAPIYLPGDPADAKFDSGDQGYDMLLEEVTQYVNSLATDYAFSNQSQWSVSAEDGILTLLWYMERYLHMARLDYPQVYAYLSGNPCWRKATLTIWGRAWLYLDKSKGNSKLNLKGAMLRGLVSDPELLDEIARLRQAEGCLP